MLDVMLKLVSNIGKEASSSEYRLPKKIPLYEDCRRALNTTRCSISVTDQTDGEQQGIKNHGVFYSGNSKRHHKLEKQMRRTLIINSRDAED